MHGDLDSSTSKCQRRQRQSKRVRSVGEMRSSHLHSAGRFQAPYGITAGACSKSRVRTSPRPLVVYLQASPLVPMSSLQMDSRSCSWFLCWLRRRFCSSLPGSPRKRRIRDARRPRDLFYWLAYRFAVHAFQGNRRCCAATWPKYQLRRYLRHYTRSQCARPHHHCRVRR